jgi:hypothetical protein
MSNVTTIIQKIKRVIPKQVLEVAFLDGVGRNGRNPTNLDWKIRNAIIDGWVRVDLDLMGAEEVNIPLQHAEVTYDNQYRITARIPKEVTAGRSIVQALALNYIYNTPAGMVNNGFNNNSFNMSNCGNSPLLNSASKILRAASPAPILSSASVQLMGENVILITDYMGSVTQCSVTCRVSHDPELNNINPKAVDQFAQLCVYAAKAWIYTNTIINIDMAELYGGADLGRIKDVIDGYADAHDNYETYKEEVIHAVNFMNDDQRNGNYLRMLISGQA